MLIRDLDETIAACLAGVHEAWHSLFDDYASVIYGALRGMGAQHEAAEDVVGDVFLRLIEDREECFGKASFANVSQFRQWMLVLAKHRYLDVWGHEQITRPISFDEAVERDIVAANPVAADPAREILVAIEARTEVERAMAALSSHEQLMIALFYFHELRLREIAELTDSPIGSVSSAIARAREKMRRCIEGVEREEASSTDEAAQRNRARGWRRERDRSSTGTDRPVEVYPA